MLGRWIGVLHIVGSALCNWIISDKGKFLSRTTVQHITAEEPIYPDVQEQICDYHGSLEDIIGSKDFGTSLYVYESLINDDEGGVAKGENNEEGYQGPPYPPEIDEIMDNSDEERSANSYDQYIGSEVVIPDRKGEKLMGKVSRCVRYNDTITGKVSYNTMHDKYLYEFEYPDGTTEKLAANIIV